MRGRDLWIKGPALLQHTAIAKFAVQHPERRAIIWLWRALDMLTC